MMRNRAVLFALAVTTTVLVLALPASAQKVVVEHTRQFETAVARANQGLVTEIVLKPGRYNLTKCVYLQPGHAVTIRGETGNRDDVVLYGGGMNNESGGIYEAIQLADAPGSVVKDLTIEGFFHHAIHFQGSGANDVLIDNVRTLNIGEQHMKSASGSRKGVIQNCLMEQTETNRNGFSKRPADYVGGIDMHGCSNWTIRDNVIKNIMGGKRDGDSGIFLWNGCDNNLIERNTVVNVNKGISIGNFASNRANDGNIIRNNCVVQNTNRAGLDYNDVGMEFVAATNTKVYNNTVYATNTGTNWFRTIQTGPASSVDFRNNLIRGGIKDFSGLGIFEAEDLIAAGNLVDTDGDVITSDWFANAEDGDLHLTAAAGAAVDHGSVLSDVTEDFDRQVRGKSPDMGADEYVP